MAAGIGKRLQPLTDKLPKCLIKINGKTLIERHFEALRAGGIKEICVVIGHKKDMIVEHLGNEFNGIKISYIENKDFADTGSGYSLYLGLKGTAGEVLFMDADIAYESEAIKPILSLTTDVLLVGNDKKVDNEGVKVLADGKIVKEMGKETVKDFPCVGESVGIVRLSEKSKAVLLNKMNGHVKNGDLNFEWEHVLNESLEGLSLTYLTTGKAKWVEIDFLRDIEAAKLI
jgi:choline kinase